MIIRNIKDSNFYVDVIEEISFEVSLPHMSTLFLTYEFSCLGVDPAEAFPPLSGHIISLLHGHVRFMTLVAYLVGICWFYTN